MLTRRFILAAAAATAASAALPTTIAASAPPAAAATPRNWYAIFWDEHVELWPGRSAEEAKLGWLTERTGAAACMAEGQEDCRCDFCAERDRIEDVSHHPEFEGREAITLMDYYEADYGVTCQSCGEPYAYKSDGGAIIDGQIYCEECAREVRLIAELEAEEAAEAAAHG
jgi:hypothetical protein